ncbi:MAG: hypothetical protein CV090_09360 [Nitrospira sp. WS238]|nr:hypothetical protein [Nitrospira sp. WS238]
MTRENDQEEAEENVIDDNGRRTTTRKREDSIMAWATVASDLQQLGNSLSADIIGWGAAVIGIALTASAVLWVLRILRA